MYSSAIAGSIARFARGAADGDFVNTVAYAIPAAWQGGIDDLARLDGNTLLYERLCCALRQLPPGTQLLANPWLLYAVLERAAVVEPRLFHVMMLHYTLCLAPITRFGDPDSVQNLVTDLEAGDLIGCPLMIESGKSNSHLNLRTTATYNPASGGFVLQTPDADARKIPSLTANPRVGKLAMVFADLVVSGTSRGVFAFAVQIRDDAGALIPGVHVTPLASSTALRLDFGAVSFNQLHVPFDMWMNDGAKFLPNNEFQDPVGTAGRSARTMSVGPMTWQCIISMCAAISRSASAIALEYSAKHFSANPAISSRPLIYRRNQCDAIFCSFAKAFTLTALANHAKGQCPKEDEGMQNSSGPWESWVSINQEMALIKASASDLAAQVISRCRKHCGSNGIVGTGLFGDYYGLADTYVTAGSANQVIMIEAGSLMAEMQKAELPSTVPDLYPTSLRACREVAEYAEAKLHCQVITDVTTARFSHNDPSEALNVHLPMIIDTGTARADSLLLSVLEMEVAKETDPEARQLFEDLATIYALEWVERRAGILFELGLLKGGSINSVRTARAKLCDGLIEYIPDLVRGFSPPTEFFINLLARKHVLTSS